MTNSILPKAESRSNWFSQAGHPTGIERTCLLSGCGKRFQNGPGEDYRRCKAHRKLSEGLGGNHGSEGRSSGRAGLR